MANAQLLVEKFENSGKTKSHLSKKMKVSRPRLDKIFEVPETATVGQADVLSNELAINALEKKDIFLPN